MSKRTTSDDIESAMKDFYENKTHEIEDTDCGILLDINGNLKSLFGPDELFADPSDLMLKLFEVLGINDPGRFQPAHTIH
jgi:hypothetical protein